ncbi:glutamate decarboxylase [bacterium]|nr:glutamate decarboxylase [bacterium]
MKEQKSLNNMSKNDLHHSCSYAGRYMTEPIPKYTLPEDSLPSDLAYRLIHDEISIDGRPGQNLATFCTTWMEPEADKLIVEGIHYNLADEDEYPHVIEIQERCVNMLANLFHAPSTEHGGAIGTATIGSSEAMMLAGLALKFNWRDRRLKKEKPVDKPNLVMGNNVQICWKKFARYFDVEPKYLPLEPGRYVITPEQIAEAVDENTIGVCAVLGSTFTGEFEAVKEIGEALTKVNDEKGWDIPIHVDGASGAMVAPFLYPELEWDFQVPLVRSINVSGHKYGLCYPGIGWVIFRNKEALPEDLIFHVNYLGGDMPTFNLNFSRPASGVLSQYYNFLHLGHEGFTNIMRGLKANSDFIREEIIKMGEFDILSDDHSLPLVAWACKHNRPFTAFDLSDKLRERGWIVPAYTMPKNAEKIACMRAVVREGMSRDLAENLVRDIRWALEILNKLKPRNAAEYIYLENLQLEKNTGIC